MKLNFVMMIAILMQPFTKHFISSPTLYYGTNQNEGINQNEKDF